VTGLLASYVLDVGAFSFSKSQRRALLKYRCTVRKLRPSASAVSWSVRPMKCFSSTIEHHSGWLACSSFAQGP
jgi:hypothetical protein